ncbi:protein-tyrosine phosphatase-like protein, partial [Cladochytrium replicatum]
MELKSISVDEVVHIPLYEHGSYLLLDVRDNNQRESAWIYGSLHLDAQSLNNSTFQTMMQSFDDIRDRPITHAIIYDNDGLHVQSIFDSFAPYFSNHGWSTISYMTGGFLQFLGKYPFLVESPGKSLGDIVYPCEILPKKLYLGSSLSATDEQLLTDMQITHIMNVTIRSPHVFPDRFVYRRVGIEDSANVDIVAAFLENLDFFDDHRDGVFLVHCEQGVSRSASIVIAYLIKYGHCRNFDEAFEFVRKRRTLARPNQGFEKSLRLEFG